MVKVLYEDNHLIAVIKPAGIPSQPDKSGHISMLEEVKKYLKEKYKKPGNVFVGLLHRLDRPVSGIMLFAKTSKGAARLSEQFRNNEIQKTYHALIIGRPTKDKGVLVNYLGKDQKLKKAKEYADGKESILHYEVLQSDGRPVLSEVEGAEGYSLLKIRIEGGKFHQIRAQLSLAGFPIVGDIKYLPAGRQVEARQTLLDGSIALCATGLSFTTAIGDKKVNLSIDIPKDWGKYIK